MNNFKEIWNGVSFPHLCIITAKWKKKASFISSYQWIKSLVIMVKSKCGFCVDGDLN